MAHAAAARGWRRGMRRQLFQAIAPGTAHVTAQQICGCAVPDNYVITVRVVAG